MFFVDIRSDVTHSYSLDGSHRYTECVCVFFRVCSFEHDVTEFSVKQKKSVHKRQKHLVSCDPTAAEDR